MVSNPFKKAIPTLDSTSSPQVQEQEQVQAEFNKTYTTSIDEPGRALDGNTTAVGTPIAQSFKSEKEGLDSAPQEAIEYPTGTKLVMIILSLLLVNLLCALDQTIVAAAIPTIANNFNALSDVGWYGSAYLLTGVAFQPLFGKAYRFFSLKWVFLGSVVAFLLGSIVCAVAQSSSTFIVGRAIAGLGFGGSYVGVLAIGAACLPLEKQALFTSIIGASFGLGACAGPVIGGSLTTKVSWRWCFWINVPIGVVAILAIIIYLNPPVRKQPLTITQRLMRMDWIGTGFLLGSIICILIALQGAGITDAWNSSKIIGLLVGFILLFLAFMAAQVYMGEDASIPRRIFLQRNIFCAAMVNFCIGPIYFTTLYFVPIYFQAVRGSSAIHSGVQALPLIVSIIISIILCGGLVSTFGSTNWEMLIGAAVAAIGGGLISTWKVDTNTGVWIGYQILCGVGIGAVAMMPFMLTQIALPEEDRQTGATIAIFAQTLGATIFVSGSQSIYQNKLKNGIELIPGLDIEKVLGSGVSGFREVVSAEFLPQVIEVAVEALKSVFLSVAIISAIGFCFALGVGWVKIEKGQKIDMGMA